MNIMADTWKNINELIDIPFDNILPSMATCRVLYLQALKNNMQVIDIPKSIGDIYRNEDINQYITKIKHDFNKEKIVNHVKSNNNINSVQRYLPSRFRL
jgi:hypothetical protein